MHPLVDRGDGPVQQQLTIYGRLNTGLEAVRASAGDSVTRPSNYRSVLGFRDEEALGGGLRALWQLEGSLALDTGGGLIVHEPGHPCRAGRSLGHGVRRRVDVAYNAATSGFDPFKLGYALPEETVAGSGARPWLASGSLVYETERLVLAAAVEHHEAYQAKDTADVGVKLGAAYQWAGPLTGTRRRQAQWPVYKRVAAHGGL